MPHNFKWIQFLDFTASQESLFFMNNIYFNHSFNILGENEVMIGWKSNKHKNNHRLCYGILQNFEEILCYFHRPLTLSKFPVAIYNYKSPCWTVEQWTTAGQVELTSRVTKKIFFA